MFHNSVGEQEKAKQLRTRQPKKPSNLLKITRRQSSKHICTIKDPIFPTPTLLGQLPAEADDWMAKLATITSVSLLRCSVLSRNKHKQNMNLTANQRVARSYACACCPIHELSEMYLIFLPRFPHQLIGSCYCPL